MEQYLKQVLEQVRCKKAHAAIYEEVKGHIEEQKKDNIAQGMSAEKAEQEAVLDMGSPVETGILLDRIHRPKTAWQVIVFMALLTAATMFIHWEIGMPHVGMQALGGFFVMLVVYHLDYTTIAAVAKPLGIAFHILCGYLFFTEHALNGTMRWVVVPIVEKRVSLFALLMLYVPLYGAILYQYYGMRYRGLLKAILWAVFPLIFALHMPSIILTFILFVSMATMLMIAIVKGWFFVPRKKTLLCFGICFLVVPALVGTVKYMLGGWADYQVERLRSFVFGNSGEDYIRDTLYSYMTSGSLWGGNAQGIKERLPDYNNSFILTYLTTAYGYVVCIGVCVALAVLLYSIFAICFQQKNQLGMMMGCGSGMILLLNVLINVAENFGLLPVTQTFLPFFSQGGSCMFLCYSLMGIILSVYRYKDVYSVHVPRVSWHDRKAIGS